MISEDEKYEEILGELKRVRNDFQRLKGEEAWVYVQSYFDKKINFSMGVLEKKDDFGDLRYWQGYVRCLRDFGKFIDGNCDVDNEELAEMALNKVRGLALENDGGF